MAEVIIPYVFSFPFPFLSIRKYELRGRCVVTQWRAAGTVT